MDRFAGNHETVVLRIHRVSGFLCAYPSGRPVGVFIQLVTERSSAPSDSQSDTRIVPS